MENNGSDDFIGFVRGFTLTITGSVITNKPVTSATAVYNAADLESGAIAPGELLNILGANLGPTPAVSAGAGDLPTTLGGVQVAFDGAPAAISYVSPYVLTVQVPFSVQAGKQSQMVVSYQNTSSDPIALDVLNTAPGLYTESGTGRGAVSAVNPDGTMNSASNPAPKGRQVVLYAAGLGALNPALTTGKSAGYLSAVEHLCACDRRGRRHHGDSIVCGRGARISGAVSNQPPDTRGFRFPARPFTIFAGGVPSQYNVAIFVQ